MEGIVMVVALTRGVSGGIGGCELTYVGREEIDVARARGQHAGYEAALRGLGVRVERVAGGEAFADGVFIEDTAVVVAEVAVVTRPGAASRRGETEGVAAALEAYRRVVRITEPGTVDGGDVLCVGKRVWVGRSSRSNAEGIGQLARVLGEYGYRVEGVEVRGCLHLKSAATAVSDGVVLVNPAWVEGRVFAGMEVVAVDPGEAMAANVVRVGDRVLAAGHYPRTAELLERRGVRVVRVACDELAKAEGALTCCSVIFEAGRNGTTDDQG